MKEQTISFETANLAEEKGYPFEYISVQEVQDVPTNIPTQSILKKWLREKHDLEVLPEHMADSPLYKYKVYKILKKGKAMLKFKVNLPSYEIALEKGLQEGLKLIK